MGAITGTGYYPSAVGFRPGGSWIGNISGGTTIAGVLEIRIDEDTDTWEALPDAAATISGTWDEFILSGSTTWFRYNISSISGTWYENHETLYNPGNRWGV